MTTIFVSHRVADYDAWRLIYDDDRPRREALGLEEAGHFHSGEDRNRFYFVWKTQSSIGDARAAIDAMVEEIRDLMAEGGLLEPPAFFYCED